MVANPMQRKARNSFLLGVLVTLIICLIIFALLYFLVLKEDEKQEEKTGEKVIAYVLNQNVKSGDIVTSDLLTQIEVYDTMIPMNYLNSMQLSNLSLQDEKGNMLYTDANGNLYINKVDNKQYETTTVEENEKDEGIRVLIKQDEQGLYKTKITGEKEYIQIDEQTIVVNSKRERYVIQRDNIQYLTTGEEGKENRVLIQEDSEGFYRTKTTGEKDYIELLNVPVVAKIDMYKNSVVTLDALASSDQLVTDDTRYTEYNMLVLPTSVDVGDFIDIRLTLPNGQDLIVVSKKEVQSILGNTIGLQLTEEEILMMESAIVEAYIMKASKFYVIQYVEAGIQDAAEKTYTPTEAVQGLIERNPNITTEARMELQNKFNADIRTWINADKNVYQAKDEAKPNLEEGIQEEIENARAAREAYLSGLTSY